ncbi:MAG: GldG family protein, partial [Pseudomonadota bacterium]
MVKRAFLPLVSALSLGIFVLANSLFQPLLAGWRIDFSEGDQFTLSEGTRATLRDLAEPVDLTFVYTRAVGQNYPAVRAYAQRVREILQAYRTSDGRKVRLTEIDPKPFSEQEDEALAAGITAIQTDGTDPLYFGLIGRNTVDDELVIPFLAPERESTLEYDLTRLIARLDAPEPATIGILTDLPGLEGDGEDSGTHVLREIANVYRVEPIGSAFTSIPDSVDVLMVAHATSLTDWQTYLIDQFILEKGRALMLIDPASKANTSDDLFDVDGSGRRSDIEILGEAWGIALSEQAVADAAHALPVTLEENGRLIDVGQPLFIGVTNSLMSADDLITASLSRTVNLGAPGALEAFPPDGLTFDVIMRTGEAPSFIDADLATEATDPKEILRAYAAEDGQLTLAGRLSGALSSAFPNGPPQVDEADTSLDAELVVFGSDDQGPHLAISRKPVEIVIIADTDLLDDGFYIDPRSSTPVGDNATLILNALDNLTGGENLLGLRSRAPNLRRMTRVDRMRSEARDRVFDEQVRLEARLTASQRRLEELQSVGATGGFFSGDLEADLTIDERAELA